MHTVVLGERLTISFPDGFHILDDKEKSKLQFVGDGPGECLSDSESHILISLGWKPIGSLPALLVSAKDAAKRMEASIRKPMQQYGYRLNEFTGKKIGGEQAEGFSYAYTAQNISMYGESYVIKRDRTLYYLHFYARSEYLTESLDIWNLILSSAEWA